MVVVVMGVAGSGKSTVGPLIAKGLGGDFAEGDQFHPAANIAKMTSGQPLNDDDRMPWLAAMATAIQLWSRGPKPTVLACSALKQLYRELLARGTPELRFVYLKGTPELIGGRMATRSGHFMPRSLLDSQFQTLEEPGDAIILDATQSPAAMAEAALAQLQGRPR